MRIVWSRRFAVCASAGLVSLVGLSHLAHGAVVSSGGGGGTFTIPCASPTLTQCETPSFVAQCSWACSSVYQNQKATLKAQVQANFATKTQSSVLAPDGAIDSVYEDKYANGIQVAVVPHSSAGQALPLWLKTEQTSPTITSASVMKHPEYAPDQKVSSCEEYTYQKLWDWKLFDDAARSLGTDYWSIFHLGFKAGAPGFANRTLHELGTGAPILGGGVNTKMDRSKVWAPFDHHPKNPFFGSDWANLFAVLPTVAGAPSFNNYGVPTTFEKNGVLTTVAPGLQNALQYPRQRDYNVDAYGGEINWHAAMGIEQWPADGGPPTAAMAAQVNERLARLAVLVDGIYSAGVTAAVIDYESHYPNTPCISRGPAGACQMAVYNGAYGVPITPPLDIRAYPIPQTPNPYVFDWTGDTRDGSWLSAYAAAHPEAQAYSTAITNAAVGDPTTVAANAQRAFYEALLFDYLQDEWNLPQNGCFNPNSNLCDWSPKQFAIAYVGYYDLQAEQLYRTCTTNTGDNFPAVAYADAPDCKGLKRQQYWFPPNSYQGNYTGSTAAVEQYMSLYQQRDALWKKFYADQASVGHQIDGMPVDTHAGPAQQGGFSETTSDTGSLGDSSSFNGSYSYSANWSVWDVEHTLIDAVDYRTCRLNGQMGASLTADAGAFGLSRRVLDASYAAQATDGGSAMQAHFTVLGTELFTPASGTPTSMVGHAAPFTVDVPVTGQNLANASIVDDWILLAGVIPVHLQAYIAATAGADESLQADASGACDKNLATRNVTYNLNGGVTPWVRADLIAQAEVDVGIADAGVRADLNLVTLKLPFNMGINVRPLNGTGRYVQFSESLDADTDELSGYLEVFADLNLGITSEHASKQIFSWEGFHQAKALWHPAPMSFDLDALGIRLYGVPTTTGAASTPASCPIVIGRGSR